MKDQTAYLEFVLEKLRERIQKISLSLADMKERTSRRLFISVSVILQRRPEGLL